MSGNKEKIMKLSRIVLVLVTITIIAVTAFIAIMIFATFVLVPMGVAIRGYSEVAPDINVVLFNVRLAFDGFMSALLKCGILWLLEFGLCGFLG
jgi:hypothetical protein